MYNQGAVEGAANRELGSRVFVYEVVGLRQNEETDQTNYPIRKSGSVFIRVPYNRMNQEMRRITRLGGKIVSIQAVSTLEQLNGKVSHESAEHKEESLVTSDKAANTEGNGKATPVANSEVKGFAKPPAEDQLKKKDKKGNTMTQAKAKKGADVPVNIYRPNAPFVRSESVV